MSYDRDARCEAFTVVPETCPEVEAALYDLLSDHPRISAGLVVVEQRVKACTTALREAFVAEIATRLRLSDRLDEVTKELHRNRY